jgi:hypothetical protein
MTLTTPRPHRGGSEKKREEQEEESGGAETESLHGMLLEWCKRV